MIELRRLKAFVTVVEEGNITRAAERLCIQQPPLTRLLQGLEEELGVQLLQRLPRGVRATDAGEVLLREARTLLTRAETLGDAVRRAARGEQGHIAIGFTSSAALAREAFILYRRPAGQGLYDAILAACYRAGFSPRIVQEAPRLPATLSLVGAGLGLSIVPASMRRLGGDGIVYRAISDDDAPGAPLYLALRSNRHSPIVSRFRDLVSEAVAAEQ